MTMLRPLACVGSALALLGAVSPVRAFPAELQPIAAMLQQRGWQVLLKAPPRQGTYGMANSKKKILWVHPITEAMGIMPQTFVHEAVHAVQSCKTGTVKPIGYQPPLVTWLTVLYLTTFTAITTPGSGMWNVRLLQSKRNPTGLRSSGN